MWLLSAILNALAALGTVVLVGAGCVAVYYTTFVVGRVAFILASVVVHRVIRTWYYLLARYHLRTRTVTQKDLYGVLRLPRILRTLSDDELNLLKAASTGEPHWRLRPDYRTWPRIEPSTIIRWMVSPRQDRALLFDAFNAAMTDAELVAHLDGVQPLDPDTVAVLRALVESLGTDGAAQFGAVADP